MKKNLLILTCLVFFTACSHNLDQSSSTVCNPETGVCDEVVEKAPLFENIMLNNSDSVLNKNYPAPDLVGLENWINSDGYESLDELRGKVVLIDFWTLGCVNCIRTLPHLVETYDMYQDKDFEIIAIHAPEFAYEQKLEAVLNAVEEYNLTYPVVQDNDFMTWRAYKNRYWPAHYLIDKQGNVRYTHFGEGKYQEMRQAIDELLLE